MLPNLLRDLPPEGGPERPSLHVGELYPYRIERNLIDFKYGTAGVQKADKLNHGVQRDARQLLPVLLTSIGREERGATDIDER